ncbi:MAG: hypothetical protein C5B53_02925 [Candidatus Melainabacteria bacterium]|nr:MAG: hypothetical protein C5B53_02925 [Candidatus Melainabacteria bacterium]
MSLRADRRSSFENSDGNGSRFNSNKDFDVGRLGLSSLPGNIDGLRYPDCSPTKSALPALLLFGRAGDQFLCREDGKKGDAEPEPATEKARKEVHDLICSNGSRLVSDINSSNKAIQVPRALAESTLRVFSLGMWGGTGITKHASEWQDLECRKAVISPGKDKNGMMDVGPEKWAACFKDVQERLDHNRKWGNCAEQAASMAHMIHKMMINNPDLPSAAGLQVRQAYHDDHSWVEVKYPNGQVMVYDPWDGKTGRLEDMPASYRESAVSPWYGREKK